MPDRRSPQAQAQIQATQQQPERRRAATADSATLEEQCHPRKIFIGGLAHKTTTQNLRDYFAHYGAIVDAVVLRWPDGRSRGFGYVTFSEASGATAALREQHQVGGRQVDVKRAVPGTNKLFVGGLPQNATAAELREHFEAFGVVSDAVVMIDPATSRSRGFGFVCFLPGQEGAAAVTSSLERYAHHRIRGKWIEVKSAAPPHKLVGKDGTAPGSGPESAAKIAELLESEPKVHEVPFVADRKQLSAGPVVNARPVASPTRRREPRAANAVTEPQKVPLLATAVPPPGLAVPPAAAVAAQAATAAHAAASMGPPPGLAVPAAQEACHRAAAAPSAGLSAAPMAPYVMPWQSAAAPQPPQWPALLPNLRMLSSLKAAAAAQYCAGGICPGMGFEQRDQEPQRVQPSSNLGDSIWDNTSSLSGDGLFGTSAGLQKSLEQLLRLHSEKLAIGSHGVAQEHLQAKGMRVSV